MTHPSLHLTKSRSATSQSPNTIVNVIPTITEMTAMRARLNSTTISLGSSRRCAARLKIPASIAPPRTRNTPAMWKTSSQW